MSKEVSLQLDYGADTRYGFQLRDAAQHKLQLNGFTAELTVYPYRGSDDLRDTLSVGDGITIAANEGVVWVTFTASRTEDYPAKSWYRLEIISPDTTVTRVAYGALYVRR